MMNKGKIALWSVGGLVVSTGLFFLIRTLIRNGKSKNDLENELERLRRLQEDNSISVEDQNKLNELEETYTPTGNETTRDVGGCGFPLGNNSGGKSGCKQVAQLQIAMNEKHLPGRGTKIWACNGTSQKLAVDGTMGGSTLKAIGRFYGEICCKSTGFLYETCNCMDCSISETQFNNITKGADISDQALVNSGFMKESDITGTTYSNFNLPHYGKKYDSVFGDFYKGTYDFIDDYPEQSSIEHSYGVGKGFGFDGSESNGNEDMSVKEDWTGFEADTQSWDEFINDVP